MKIYLDNIIYSLQRAGGISIYWKELTQRFLASDNQIIFLEKEKATDNIFRRELTLMPGTIVNDLSLPTRVLRHLDPFFLKTDNQAIFHSSYYRIIARRNLLNIVTVHDFIHELYRKGLPRIAHSFQKSRTIQAAAGIICVSENTKRDLLRFYPFIPEDKISVIYHGYSSDFHVITSLPGMPSFLAHITRKLVVFIGDRAAYKNFTAAVLAVGQLADYHLLIIGGHSLSSTEKVLLRQKVAGRYSHHNGIKSHELNIIYNIACCLIYPSSYEGFGIPVLEAMAAGCPVIAIDTSSIPEVAGKAAILLPRPDPILLAKAIEQLSDLPIRKNLIMLGLQQAKKFSWDKCFDQTVSFYQKIASSGQR